MGGYDLYGQYYPNSRDALNAEMAQCAEIDAGIQARKLEELQDARQSDEYYANMRMHLLEARIAELEQTIAYLLGVEKPRDSSI